MKNLEKYRSVLGARFDGLLLTSPVSRMYCAEFDVAEGVSIIAGEGCRFFTDSRYIEVARKNLPDFEVIMVDRTYSYTQAINDAIREFHISTLGFEETYLTCAEFRDYEEKLNAKLVPCQKEINAFRVVKEDWELSRMYRAQEITDLAFSEVLAKIHKGMTEKELAAELIYCLYKNGAEGLSFAPIVAAGPNGSMPHAVPSDRKIQSGEFITMDFGVIWKGYCSDMTRTVALGDVSAKMRTVYETVLRAQLTGIAATYAGVTGQAIDAAARQVITAAGYGDCFGHGYGHCLGLEIHESPNCNPSNDQPMPAGSVSSAEPGIYFPGEFGVRIEDVVLITEKGCTDLTKSPKDLIIL
jgi:Xaa-Pro aminopeptidase